MISPNLCHDGRLTHRPGGPYLSGLVPPLLRALGSHGYLILSWDEGTTDARCGGGSSGGRISAIVLGADVHERARRTAAVDQYGVLAIVEGSLRLPRLGAAWDRIHGTLRDLFTRRAPIG